jgi:hypothetical protein
MVAAADFGGENIWRVQFCGLLLLRPNGSLLQEVNNCVSMKYLEFLGY